MLNLINQTSLHELASYISLSDFYIGSDTGATHMASFLNKPSLIYYSAKSNPPSRWGSFSNHVVVIRYEYQTDISVDSTLIYDKFFRLMKLVSYNESRDLYQKNIFNAFHSFRILNCFSNKIELLKFKPMLDECLTKDIVCFSWIGKSFNFFNIFKLLTYIETNNINVIHGKLNWFYKAIITFYFGTIRQYIVPVFWKSILTYI